MSARGEVLFESGPVHLRVDRVGGPNGERHEWLRVVVDQTELEEDDQGRPDSVRTMLEELDELIGVLRSVGNRIVGELSPQEAVRLAAIIGAEIEREANDG